MTFDLIRSNGNAARTLVAIFLSISVLGTYSGCGAEAPPVETSPEPEIGDSETRARPEPGLILLISVDTLRADHLGLYGHHRFTSPSLDLFALGGTVFEDASSVAPWTLPAHASMLTGLYPLSHGVIDVDRKLPKEIPTLARLLADGGWTTAAAVNSSWLLKDRHEVTRDFDHFLFVEDIADERLPTTAITNRALHWIREFKDSNLFIFMHYYDIHSDYASIPRYEKLLVSEYDGKVDGTTWQLNIASMPDAYIESCKADFDKEKCTFGGGDPPRYVDGSTEKIEFQVDDLQHLEELYDAGIRQFDDELNRLFKALAAENRLESAQIIITSDHGEEFSEHGSFYHFITTYQEILHVPLIFRGHGIAPNRRVSAPVSIVDIVPTILGWAKIEAPPATEGIDLGPLLEISVREDETRRAENELMKRFQYAEAAGGLQWERTAEGLVPTFSSIRQGNFKWVNLSEGWESALYDLSNDPGERSNIAHERPALAESLREAMEIRRAEMDSRPQSITTIEIDPEEAERLRALGYIIDE